MILGLVNYNKGGNGDVSMKAEPWSCAVAEDMIKLLFVGWEAGRRHIGMLQVCKRNQYCGRERQRQLEYARKVRELILILIH